MIIICSKSEIHGILGLFFYSLARKIKIYMEIKKIVSVCHGFLIVDKKKTTDVQLKFENFLINY